MAFRADTLAPRLCVDGLRASVREPVSGLRVSENEVHTKDYNEGLESMPGVRAALAGERAARGSGTLRCGQTWRSTRAVEVTWLLSLKI